MAKTATYKGKTYRLVFIGETKFGRRAKLSFTDGTKEFWVNAALVTEGAAASGQTRSGSPRGTRTGCQCGSVEEYSKPSDCWTCRHDA